jgi:hypothetical protein
MHRRKNYRKSVTTKLPASVGIATTGDVGTTGVNRGAMTAAIHVVAVVAVVADAVNSVRSGELVAGEIASVASVVEAVVTAIAIPGRASCRSRRKACA